MDKETLLLPRQARDRPNVNKKTTHTTQNWRRRWGWRLIQLIRIHMSVQAAQREAAIVTSPWLAHERHKREIERSAAELFIIGTFHYGERYRHTLTLTLTLTRPRPRPRPRPLCPAPKQESQVDRSRRHTSSSSRVSRWRRRGGHGRGRRRPQLHVLRHCRAVLHRGGAERAPFVTWFCAKSDRVTKTGSGPTQRKA